MHVVARRASAAIRGCAIAFFGGAAIFSSGCALVPTLDDVQTATATVKDTVTGKSRRDYQNKTYAEARILERRKDYATAERMYRELLTHQPRSRDCHHRLAVMAAVQGKFEEANQLYTTARECGPPTADLWSDIGYCHYLQHQLPEAEGALREALKVEPQHLAAMNNLGMVLGEAGNLDESYRYFRQANGDAEAEANFAYVCAQCGDLERAQQHYSRALSYNPELRVATEALLQVTHRLQLVQEHQATSQAAAEGEHPAVDTQVRQVSHDEPLDDSASRPLIEVFTAAPSRAAMQAYAESRGTVNQVMNAQAAGPMPTPASRTNYQALMPNAPTPQGAPTGFPQPQSVGVTPGGSSAAPQPYSAPSQAQPAYLQPTFGPRNAQTPLGTSGMGLSNAAGNSAANAGAVLSAGAPFPPLVGGASALR